LKVLEIPVAHFAKAFSLPLVASCVMVAGIAVLKWAVAIPVAFSVIVCVLLGIILYASTVLIINRKELIEIRSMFIAKT